MGEPVIVDEGNMLKRLTVAGPTLSWTVDERRQRDHPRPSAVRTSRRWMSSISERNF